MVLRRCDEEKQRRTGLTLNLLTTAIVAPPSNASKWQIGFNSAFKGLIRAKINRYIKGRVMAY